MPVSEAEAFDKLVRRRSKAATGAEDGLSSAQVLRGVMRAAVEAEGLGPVPIGKTDSTGSAVQGVQEVHGTAGGAGAPSPDPDVAGELRKTDVERMARAAGTVAPHEGFAIVEPDTAASDFVRAYEEQAVPPPPERRYVERDDARHHSFERVPKNASKRCSACGVWEHAAGALQPCRGTS